MSGKETGRMGEKLAAEVLEKNGYNIITRNLHSLYGEVDLVVRDSEYICFVEVKVRQKDSMVSPLESITKTKKKRIILTALVYLRSHPGMLQPRFDVFSIITEGDKVASYEHLKGAFDADGY